jgi:hypothetical protein
MIPISEIDNAEYISISPLLTIESAREKALRIQIFLDNLYQSRRITGYSTRVLKNDNDVEYEDLDPNILKEENGVRFPAIWVNIGYKRGTEEELKEFLNQLVQDFDLENT